MSERNKGRYDQDDFATMRSQDILDTSEALDTQRRAGLTIEREAATHEFRAGTVEGYKNWIESLQSETGKRLKEVEQQLQVAEAFAALPSAMQEKFPITDRPLRVSYARELKQQLTTAIRNFQNELESADRALLDEAARRISEE